MIKAASPRPIFSVTEYEKNRKQDKKREEIKKRKIYPKKVRRERAA